MTSPLVRRGLWLAMTLLCLLFAPTAAEFYWLTVTEQTATYARLLSVTVSDAYAFGPRSGFAIMTPYWRAMPAFNQIVLGIHACLASVALVIGPFQFAPLVRRRWPRAHRRLGRIYMVTGIVAMLLSMLYLSLTPMNRIYGGPPFAIGLWGIAVLTLYTFIMGWWHIVRGDIDAHQKIMVLNFSAMLIAPLLRLWWLILGRLFLHLPNNAQDENHVAVLMFLGLETMVGAILISQWIRTQPARRVSPLIAALRRHGQAALKTVIPWSMGLGVLAALLLFSEDALRFTHGIDIFQTSRPDVLLIRETQFFTGHQTLISSRTLCLAGVYIFTPHLVRTLFVENRAPNHATWVLLAGMHIIVASSWLFQAGHIGRQGVAGWGSSVYTAAVACALLLFTGLWVRAIQRGAWHRVREWTLHLYALALTPITLLLLRTGFCALGFSFRDAFLSAGVLATSLNLSASYYYTVYARHVPSTPAPSPLPVKGKIHPRDETLLPTKVRLS